MLKFKEMLNTWDRMMAAITFAEAGEREIALDIMDRTPEMKKHKRAGAEIRRPKESRPDLRM